METIKNYLDNMFTNLPKTASIIKLKEDLLNNMEDKYNELKQSGKSENEAVGIVISEFGNIDELIKELDIEIPTPYSETSPVITREEADHIVYTKRTYGTLIAFGVFLCIMAPALFILVGEKTASLNQTSFTFALPALLIPIAIAVGIFIFSGMQISKFEYLKEDFILDYHASEFIRNKKIAYQASYTAQVIIGVMICILSVLMLVGVPIFVKTSGSTFFFLFLFLIAIAVFLFIHSGCIMSSYHELLQEKEYARKVKKSNRLAETIGAVVWPITTAIYLLYSFTTGNWHISWIIFPVVAILLAGFSNVCTIINGDAYNKQ